MNNPKLTLRTFVAIRANELNLFLRRAKPANHCVLAPISVALYLQIGDSCFLIRSFWSFDFIKCIDAVTDAVVYLLFTIKCVINISQRTWDATLDEQLTRMQQEEELVSNSASSPLSVRSVSSRSAPSDRASSCSA